MDKALQTMIENMPEKTGKSLDQWHQILSKESFEKHSHAVNYLKTEHGVTHGFANTIVTLLNQTPTSDKSLITAQYEGKESLIPMYEKLSEFILSLGQDVKIEVKKASISCIRKAQFALIKPATKTRIDLGLKLRQIEPQGKLEESGPFGTMCTHRIQLQNICDVDDEVKKWLTLAYQKSV